MASNLSFPREYRPPRWAQVVCVFGLLLFALAAFELSSSGDISLSAIAITLLLFAVVGVVDAFRTRLILFDESLVIVSNFRRREYPRSAFVAATSAKGSPVSLKFRGGGWLGLPALLVGGPGLANALRAWINRK